jgi:hypothetical protein
MLRDVRAPVAAVIVVLAACHGERAETVRDHDVRLLGAGVDARTEAAAVAEGLARAGFAVGRRVDTARFSAFDARHEDGRTVVRVITARGIAASLETTRETAGDETFSLAGEEHEQARDLDADGDPEIVLAHATRSPPRACLAVLRVLSDGTVREVPRAGVPEDACVVMVRDVGGDARPELVAAVAIDALPLDVAPSVSIVLAPRDGGYAPARGAAYRAFHEDERARRMDELAVARRALDVSRVRTLAVELAAVAREEGLSVARQLEAYDDALSGLVLSEDEADAVAFVRAHVGRGWTAEAEAPE